MASCEKRTRAESVALIADMLKKGMPKEEMAKKLGVTMSSLGNWLTDARKIAFPSPVPPKPKKSEREINGADVLAHGNSIAMRGLWRRLERWRGVSA